MRPDLLDVVAVYANPMRWQSRRRLHEAFEAHMLASGVRLTVVECAYGERPFELTALHPHIKRVQVRSKTLVWNKENLINIGISRLDDDWKNVAWIDADITFRNPNWATETVHQLQIYDVVQPWSDCYDLGPNGEHLEAHRSFLRQHWNGEPVVPGPSPWWKFQQGPYFYPHTGYAWAATRTAVNWLGGLLDICGMGSGDHHMALALVGHVETSVPGGTHPTYLAHLKRWQDRAQHHINGNLGFCWGTIEHGWHGRKNQRGYVDRWQVFVDEQFNPDMDLKRNSFGVYELAGNKPRLTHAFKQYLAARNEDANTIV